MKSLTIEEITNRCPHCKEIGRLLVKLQQKEISLPDAALAVGNEIEAIQLDAYNSAIHDAASTTNSGMDNYQRIMGLLRK